ncbi:MAG: hypothetical protein ABJN95_06690 [Maribacter sp.]|uniref:hypothetical protein n=1 Tax=Maribacter sp. TaxID=1897614 RepID=UPI0032982E4B
MKALIVVLLFLVGNSCDPVTKEAPLEGGENPVESVDHTETNTTPPIQESMNPGEITLKVKVMEVYDSGKDICGLSKTNVMKMQIQEVVERGSSIVNSPNKDDEALMNFMLAPKDLSADNHIEVKAKESLCRDASKTYFTIISYKILE